MQESKPIYLVVGLKKYPFNFKEEAVDCEPRTFGYFHDQNNAIDAVINNRCDLNEAGYYPYILIEEFNEGLHRESWESQLYEFNIETQKYTLVDPQKLTLTNFSMG